MSKIGKITSKPTNPKETIYVDIDDEITALIEKVTNSQSKIIALVLPKRSTVMQSIVNMKLLKRSADTQGKNVVLITSEPALMPLAGLAGVHVAASPTSKPRIPEGPEDFSDEVESIDEPSAEPVAEFDPKAAAAVPVGALAATQPESILMADEDSGVAEASDDLDFEQDGKVADKPKVNKKLKVPSFNKFRMVLVLGVLALILLIGGWIYANDVLPQAGIAIVTDGKTVESSLNLTLDADATKLDEENLILPAKAATTSKTYTQEVPATGQQNNGKKASGKISIVASVCTLPARAPSEVSAGSAVSSGGKTYITQDRASFSNSPKLSSDGTCLMYTSNNVEIVALKAGADFNTGSNASFAVRSSVVGNGQASGGTDEIVKVVSQADIDSAKSKLESSDTTEVKDALRSQLNGQNLLPVDSTFLSGEEQLVSTANAGDPAETVKVSLTIPYTMLGVKQDDLEKIVMQRLVEDKKIDESRQKVLDDGMDSIKFTQQVPGSDKSAVVEAKVKTTIGPNLNVATIRKDIVGMKAADVKEYIQKTPGVTEVDVAYSPFWVTKVPKNTDKITIVIDGKDY